MPHAIRGAPGHGGVAGERGPGLVAERRLRDSWRPRGAGPQGSSGVWGRAPLTTMPPRLPISVLPQRPA